MTAKDLEREVYLLTGRTPRSQRARGGPTNSRLQRANGGSTEGGGGAGVSLEATSLDEAAGAGVGAGRCEDIADGYLFEDDPPARCRPGSPPCRYCRPRPRRTAKPRRVGADAAACGYNAEEEEEAEAVESRQLPRWRTPLHPWEDLLSTRVLRARLGRPCLAEAALPNFARFADCVIGDNGVVRATQSPAGGVRGIARYPMRSCTLYDVDSSPSISVRVTARSSRAVHVRNLLLILPRLWSGCAFARARRTASCASRATSSSTLARIAAPYGSLPTSFSPTTPSRRRAVVLIVLFLLQHVWYMCGTCVGGGV